MKIQFDMCDSTYLVPALYILTSANLNKMNAYKWMNKQKCCPVVIFFSICLYFLYLHLP